MTTRVIRVITNTSDREFCSIVIARSDSPMPKRPKLSDLPEDARLALIDWLGVADIQIQATE